MCDNTLDGGKRCKHAAMVSLMASSLVLTSSKDDISDLGESYKPALAYAYSELVKSLVSGLEPSAELADALSENIRFYISEFTADYGFAIGRAKQSYNSQKYQNENARRSRRDNDPHPISEKE